MANLLIGKFQYAISYMGGKELSMKVNNNKSRYFDSTFLGGTCDSSTWRKDLIARLHDNVLYFDPQVPDCTPEDAAREDACKPVARFNVFVITGDALGTYSGWEIHEEACRAPKKLIFATIGNLPEKQFKGINKIKKELVKMGATVCESLEEIAQILNQAYEKYDPDFDFFTAEIEI